jgi:glycosyltransferase involved in cell wall biosynthesis
MQIKVGHVTHSYLPNIGGIENYIKRLAQSLEKRGHRVSIYTTDWRIKGALEENAFYCKTDFTVFRNPISFEMYRKLKRAKEDLYHFHAPWFFTHLLAERAVRHKPKVMTLHGIQLSGSPELFTINTFYYPAMRHILAKMDVIIAQAENERQIVVKRYGIPLEKVEIIPNGIETEKFKCSKKLCKTFMEKYKIDKKSFKVLFVSRLVPHKHPDKLIKAVRNYLENEDLEVIIIGGVVSNEYLETLKRLAHGDRRIHLIGEVKFDELVAAYNSSDLFVFLSTWDALSAVILEAMCCGLPILTTRTGCVPFVVKEGENGFFIDRLEEKEIAEKILKVMNIGNSVLSRIRKNNKKRIRKEYEWEKKVKDIIKVYEKVIR